MQKENAPPLIESGEAQDVSEASATTFGALSSNKASDDLKSPHSNLAAVVVAPRTTKRRHAAAAKVDALSAFRLRCEVRALLVAEGELDLQTAVDGLHFREKCAAMVTASPKLIEHVLETEQREQQLTLLAHEDPSPIAPAASSPRGGICRRSRASSWRVRPGRWGSTARWSVGCSGRHQGKGTQLCLIHSGAVFRHGFVEDYVEWKLEPDERAVSPTHTGRLSRYKTLPLLECTGCGCIRVAGQPCAACGFLPKRPSEPIVFAEGDLALVDRQRRTAQPVSDPNERMRWYAELLWIKQERGYRRGYAKHKYREKFAAEPHGYLQPREASPEVLAWVRSRNIAWAKARRRLARGRARHEREAQCLEAPTRRSRR